MKIAGRTYYERLADSRTDADIEAMAEEIVKHIPRMLKAYPTEAEFWHWFGGEVDSIRSHARTSDEKDRLTQRLIQALKENEIESDMVPRL